MEEHAEAGGKNCLFKMAAEGMKKESGETLKLQLSEEYGLFSEELTYVLQDKTGSGGSKVEIKTVKAPPPP